MAGLDQILSAAEAIDDPAIDRAMAAALPTADQASVGRIGRILLQRQNRDGTTGLILHFHRLPDDLQNSIVEQAAALFKPLRQAACRRNTHGPTNALRIIAQSQTTQLAYLVGEQLRHGSEALRQQAAACLLLLAESCATDSRPGNIPMIGPTQAAFLQSAVEEAIELYAAHSQARVLIAMAALMPRSMPGVRAVLGDADHPVIAPLGNLLTRAHDSALRQAIPVLLGFAPLAEAAVDGLRQCVAAGQLGECLSNYHMLQLAPARAALKKVKAPESLWPGDEQIKAMRTHYRRGLPAWLMSLPTPKHQKIAQLDQLRLHGDTTTRLFALRCLLSLAKDEPSNAIDSVITAFTADPKVALARIALLYLVGAKHRDLPRLLATLVNSDHDEIRRLASQRLAPLGFSRLWEQWPKLDVARRLAAGRALIKIDPYLHRALSDKLILSDTPSRLRALSIIHDLNQGDYFANALIHLLDDQDVKLASAAVKALGSANSPVVDQALEQALKHPDSRVRANAVEAMTQHETSRYIHQLAQMAKEDENRPRANAIAALLQLGTDQALDVLVNMLDDHRPAHRTSALWLVQTLGLVEVSSNVAEMSITDPNAAVKDRADMVIHDLLDLMSDVPTPQSAVSASHTV